MPKRLAAARTVALFSTIHLASSHARSSLFVCIMHHSPSGISSICAEGSSYENTPGRRKICLGQQKWVRLNASDDAPVAHLRIVMLVQQGTHNIINELVLAVDHIQRECCGEEDHGGKDQLAEDLEEDLEKFLHNLFRLS